MKLEEIKQLIKDEEKGVLRKPKTLEGLTDREILKKQKILTFFVRDIIENSNRKQLLSSNGFRFELKKIGILSFRDVNPKIGIYKTITQFGNGQFFDAHRLYPDGKYPIWVQSGMCYSNADLYSVNSEKQVEVVSGIAYVGRPFLHSVVLTEGGMVIDFAYNIVMDAELYFNLFNFEVLAKVDNQLLKEHFDELLAQEQYSTDIINFAFDEIVQNVCEENKKSKPDI